MKTIIFPRTPESVKLAKTYGYDEWLISRIMEYVPDLNGFLETMNGIPKQYIRTNRLTSYGSRLRILRFKSNPINRSRHQGCETWWSLSLLNLFLCARGK